MAQIGTLAARGDLPSPRLLQQVDEVATRAPLAEGPYLVAGAVAQTRGQLDRAERLFVEARERNPRSQAARYFLADRYLRTERTREALIEIATFARLAEGVETLAPSLAAYARSPGAVVELKRLFQASPELEPVVLSQLASNAANADLVLALWSGRDRLGSGDWQARLLSGLVDRGDLTGAYRAWQRFGGIGNPAGGLFNAQFEPSNAPPPFAWRYGAAGGVAEPLGAGRLQLIYFGREDAVLAEQLLLLRPGRYRLGVQARGDVQPGALAWTLDCRSESLLLRLPIRAGARNEAEFTVPAGCTAQRLKLTGTAGDFPKSTEATLSALALERGRP